MDTFQAIELRKSTRGYQPEQISEDLLEKVVHAGQIAPIAMGEYDKLHLTVVQNSALLEKMTAAAAQAFNNPSMKPFYGAPTVIIVSSMERGAPYVEYADASCIIENMHVAATDLGLGSVYLLAFLGPVKEDPELVKALNLPEGFTPVAALAVGYPAQQLTEREGARKTVSVNSLK